MKSLYGKVALIFLITAIFATSLIPPIFISTVRYSIDVETHPLVLELFKRFLWVTPCLYLAVLTFALGYIVIRPITTLSSAVKEIAKGNYNQEIQSDRNDEIGELIENFNAMAKQIRSTQILNQDFVGSISHEFKTPITAILGFAEELKDGDLPSDKREEALDIIVKESKRLSSMSTNILLLSKLDAESIIDKRETFSLSEQVRESILLLQNLWEDKDLELNLELEETIISGNEMLLKQVWINLFTNAIKFSSQGGKLDAEIAIKHDGIYICISNYGKEIAQKDLPHIFDMFYKADKSRNSEGNGLGLAIAKKIVQIHKGTISATSNNQKTSFCVTLPLN
ncbi:MAG: HAMP domain-containing sensor histidine kinase [Bacillota bacterium]